MSTLKYFPNYDSITNYTKPVIQEYISNNTEQQIYNRDDIKKNIIVNNVNINSIDRDWYNNTTSSPFEFMVSFGGYASNSVISMDYKNVISISLDTIISSNRFLDYNYNSNTYVRINDNPYLMASINNLEFSGRGTNKKLNETLGIYIPFNSISDNVSNVKHLEFKNVTRQVKKFQPTPLASLSQMDIKITDSQGEIIPTNDVLAIKGIFSNNDDENTLSKTDYLVIETTTYFTTNEFLLGDKILIKNFVYKDLSYEESYQLNDFMNRKEGHYILNIGKSNSNTELYNQIFIQMPANNSRQTGNFTVETWYSSLIQKSLGDTIVLCSGKLININRQTHLCFTINTEMYNSKKINNVLI
jgi:hypothetical protein